MNDTKKERRKAEKRLFFLLGLDEDDCPTSEDDEDEKDLGRPKQKSWEELCEIVDRKQAWEQQLQRNRRFSLELDLLKIKISLEQEQNLESRRFASLEETRSIHSEMKVSKPGAVEDCIQLEASMLLVENDSEANRLSDSTDNVKVLNEEDSSIMESKYSKLVETPTHANSVIDSCSCVLTRYVRLQEEQLRKLSSDEGKIERPLMTYNILHAPVSISSRYRARRHDQDAGQALLAKRQTGDSSRVWDPGGT